MQRGICCFFVVAAILVGVQLPAFASAAATVGSVGKVASELSSFRRAEHAKRAERRGISPSAVPAQPSKITFRRIFRGSSPEFIEIVVRDDNKSATYEIRQLDDDAGSQRFEVSDALRAKIFSLAQSLHDFNGQDLDVHRKIANLGEKTFRWEQGSVSHETKFNYTLNPSASQLLQIFEGLARQQEHYELLTRRIRYDRLGIYDALLQFESDLNRGLLPEPQNLVPLLDQIANDSRFVDVARQRARGLADRLRQ